MVAISGNTNLIFYPFSRLRVFNKIAAERTLADVMVGLAQLGCCYACRNSLQGRAATPDQT